MIHDCSNCIHSTKDVKENPCFKCMDTINKKYWEMCNYSNSKLAAEIRENFAIYNIIQAQIKQLPENSNERQKAILQRAATKEKLAHILFDALFDDKIRIMEVGFNGKLHTIR